MNRASCKRYCWAVTESSNEPSHDKTNTMICVPNEDSYRPGHPPSLISLRSALSG